MRVGWLHRKQSTWQKVQLVPLRLQEQGRDRLVQQVTRAEADRQQLRQRVPLAAAQEERHAVLHSISVHNTRSRER